MQPAEQQQEEQEGAQPLRFDSLSPKEFIALADMYIGGLWTRIERGLREAEGEDFDYQVKPDRGAMRVLLPYDGQLVVRKDPEGRVLVVESNLREPWEDKDCMEFRPVSESLWVNEDGESLPDFVGEAMSKYLKARVQL